MNILLFYPYNFLSVETGANRRVTQLIGSLQELGHNIDIHSLHSTKGFEWNQDSVDQLKKRNINVIITDNWEDKPTIYDFLRQKFHRYDLNIITYNYSLWKYYQLCDKYIIDTYDLLSITNQTIQYLQNNLANISYRNCSIKFFPEDLEEVPEFILSKDEIRSYKNRKVLSVSYTDTQKLREIDIDVVYLPQIPIYNQTSSCIGLPIYIATQNLMNLAGHDLLTRLKNKAQIRISGNIRDMCLKKHNYIYIGQQKNIESILNKSSFGLCPNLYGTGTKTKIIDYMSCGLPVLAFKHQAKEPYCINGETGFFVDSIEEFNSSFNTLYSDLNLRKRLGTNAHEAIHSHFNKTQYLDTLNNAIN